MLCLVTYYGKAMLNACCGLSVIFCGFIWLLIGHETINIQKIFSQTGVHGFIGKTVIGHAKWHGYLKTKSWKFKPSPEMSKVLTELNNKRFVHLESYTVSTCVSIKACENILKIPLREERVVLHNKVCSANKAMMKGCKGKSLQA